MKVESFHGAPKPFQTASALEDAKLRLLALSHSHRMAAVWGRRSGGEHQNNQEATRANVGRFLRVLFPEWSGENRKKLSPLVLAIILASITAFCIALG